MIDYDPNGDVIGEDDSAFEELLWAMAKATEESQHRPCDCNKRVWRSGPVEDGMLWECLECHKQWVEHHKQWGAKSGGKRKGLNVFLLAKRSRTNGVVAGWFRKWLLDFHWGWLRYGEYDGKRSYLHRPLDD